MDRNNIDREKIQVSINPALTMIEEAIDEIDNTDYERQNLDTCYYQRTHKYSFELRNNHNGKKIDFFQ